MCLEAKRRRISVYDLKKEGGAAAQEGVREAEGAQERGEAGNEGGQEAAAQEGGAATPKGA